MPRKHEELVYTFEELSSKAKKEALDYYRNLQHEYFDSENLTDQLKNILEERGFTDKVELGWSLGYSQGDGVAFWGDIDLKNFFDWIRKREHPEYSDRMKGALRFSALAPYVKVTVLHQGRYYHWNSMEVNLLYDSDELKSASVKRIGPKEWTPRGTQDITGLIPEFEKFMDQWVKDTSKELEKYGYAEIEYQTSDTYLEEFIEANGLEFHEDGKPFRK